MWRRKPKFTFDGDQELEAIRHFRSLIKPWRDSFTEDNWPTAADHLHELLHIALIEEGAPPEWIRFLSQPAWRESAANCGAMTDEEVDELINAAVSAHAGQSHNA